MVVVVTLRKWGHLGELRVQLGALWLAGGTGPKVSDRSVIFIINKLV